MGDNMIKEIEISKHFQIENTKIKFSENLNLIIGESGSGKSLLVESIAFLMGYDLTKETKKQGDLSINGIISINGKNTEIRRQFNGSEVKCYIDTKIVNNRDYSKFLENFTMYYDQNFMFNRGISNDYILNLMKLGCHDSFTNYISAFKSYSVVYDKYTEYKNELEVLESDHELDMINKELSKYDLVEIKVQTDGYETDIHIVEKMDEFNRIYVNLKNYENNILEIKGVLSKMYISEISSAVSLFNSFIIEYQDCIEVLKKQINEFQYKLENYSNYKEMISVKNKLCRIYNCDLNELIEIKSKSEDRITRIDELRIDLQNIEKGLNDVIVKLDIADDSLNKNIMKKSITVLDGVTKLLVELGFNCSVTKLLAKKKRLSNYKRNIWGNYSYEVVIGDDLKTKNISQLSGGELSRLIISLSLQAVKGNVGNVLIYDEIDTGISGEFSVKIGREFYNASKSNQIIAISHNPQVCAKATRLIQVKKSSSNTFSTIEEIKDECIEVEIAKMILGNIYDKNGIEVAKQLINK